MENVEKYAVFLLGVGVGIGWYKFFIMYTLGRFTHTACDYCEFRIK